MNKKLDQVAIGLDIQQVLALLKSANQQIEAQMINENTDNNCSSASE